MLVMISGLWILCHRLWLVVAALSIVVPETSLPYEMLEIKVHLFYYQEVTNRKML